MIAYFSHVFYKVLLRSTTVTAQMHASECGPAFAFHTLQITDSHLTEMNSTKIESYFSIRLQQTVLMTTMIFSFTFLLP